MSASPANAPSGPSSTTPSGSAQVPHVRKKAPVSIFTNNKRKPAKKPAPPRQPAASGASTNGVVGAPQVMNGTGATAASQDTPQDYQEFPIYVTKYALEKGLHYHALRLRAKDERIVNPYDAAQFQRPIRLHRRMARDKMETAEQSDAASGVDDKERELLSIRRAERQAEREANQALIAPTGGDSKKAVKKKPQKKVEDVYFDENNPVHKQRAQLRYEEARPWHLEDFEGKNIWVGSYEEPLSDSSVMFEIGSEGFRMVPVEKWYKFSQTNRFSVMDSDAVEKHMGQKFRAPRWFMGTQAANDEARRQAALIQREQQRARSRGFDEDDDMPMNREEYQADVDEIDFEFNDEFQDDDEGLVFADADDDAKEIEKRIRDEMRTANLPATGIKDEDKDWDDEERREKKKQKDAKKQGRRMRKQLMKKEKKNEYDSDSETNEFSEISSREDSDEERERLEEERKQEEARKQNGDKSGASTKGTNTPTGRSEKRDQGLKRPGSPDLSEMSGNESSRKKAKGINGRAVSSAPNGARSLSPDAAKRSGYGSGSDTDTSRSGRPKIRLKASQPGSPREGGSRTGSRAGSPERLPFPTAEEVRAAIPASGIELKELVALFKARVAGDQSRFIALFKQVGKQDPARKGRIILREDAPAA